MKNIIDLLNASYASSTMNLKNLTFKQPKTQGLLSNQIRNIKKANNNSIKKIFKPNHQLVNNSNQNLKFKSSLITLSALSTENASAAEPMKTLTVDLGPRSYPIYIGTGLLDKGELLCKHINGKHVLIVTNETIAPLYLEKCTETLKKENPNLIIENVILPDGEKYKAVEYVSKVWDKALESKLPRQATFIALGGGVIGDLTGFAAATYQRGVHFIQIPTTVMSQVDSSVGGKTGVNHPLGKNMIGAFYQPQCVLIDISTLNTLPERELVSGFSEIVKYGLIRDAELFEWLEENIEKLVERDAVALIHAIERSCAIKADIVNLDEREGGVRAKLNLGHTFGHAIEAGEGYGVNLHGEAVSMGITMANRLSSSMGWIESSIEERTKNVLIKAKLPIEIPDIMTPEMFYKIMSVDKKVIDGTLRLVLTKGKLGECVVTSDFDPEKLKETINFFCS